MVADEKKKKKKELPVKEGSEKKEKKTKKAKKPKERKLINVKSSKANPDAPIDPRTGTRFPPNCARQQAFEIIYKMAKEEKNAKEIREKLKSARKSEGNKYNLDPGYLHFTIAMMPEFFQIWNDGVVDVLKDPKPDPAAAKKMEEELAEKRKRAEEARKKRKEKAEGGEKKKKKKKKAPEVKE